MSALSGLAPWLEPYATYLLSYFPDLRVTSVYRSYSEQLALWNARATNPYPVAPPGHSWHEHRRAFDVVGSPERLEQAGRLWQSWGGTWGGGFSRPDPIHFQA